MASRFQAASLVASPSYPNAVAWSDENLIAVATGHLVTILNPALPFGPRGLITIPANKPFPIGVIERQDLYSGCLLSTCLSRDIRPCVRSISWSHIGLAPNAGCLLAICTIEGRVKLYRAPFCEFQVEWVEVVDITDMLYDYLANISFGESETAVSSDVFQPHSDKLEGNNPLQIVYKRTSKARSLKKIGEDCTYKTRSLKKIGEDCTLPLVTVNQYASRNAMLSSLVVAWSPVLCLPPETDSAPPDNSSNCFSLLAVGGKSGKISFWRVHEPLSYTVEHSRVPISVMLAGFHQAHNTWVTAISWALLTSDASSPQVLLATGSTDGSVKIWLEYSEKLLKSSEVNDPPFSLLKEVINADSVPVSVLTLIVPVQSPQKMFLAVGKGCGSFEVWICDLSIRKFDRIGSYNAHDHVVTGLAWAFDGCCLYSCSQDNSVRSWSLCGNSLDEVPIPPNTPGVKNPADDLPYLFGSCYGVAVSPGNLVVAVARGFDAGLLNPMYQARTQKAAIEFFWIGGQQLESSTNRNLEFGIENFPGFPKKELIYWECNMLWYLSQYEHLDKPLVVWDIVAALLAFKQSAPKYVELVLVKWLSVSNVESHLGLSTGKILSHASRTFSNTTTRKLHLFNIICRHVVLSELKADKINCKQPNLEEFGGAEEEKLKLWMELLLCSERELRERLVGFAFSTVLGLMSSLAAKVYRAEGWDPVGLAQMEQWVALNYDHVQDQLKLLASEVRNLDKRKLHSVCEYVAGEQCSYCSACVPFESPEIAFCQGAKCSGGVGQSHKLARCAVCMQVCPASPSWFCTCCQRYSSKLAPPQFFLMPRYPLDFKSSTESCTLNSFSKPFCPFCGILLQRLQPVFLLSASPA